MKPYRIRHAAANCHRRGSTLIVTLFALMVITSTLGGYMLFTTHNSTEARRTDLWESAIHVAEAGVEEAMSHYQQNDSSLASQGWSDGGTYVQKTTAIDTDSYVVTITKGANPIIKATASVTMPGTRSTVLKRAVQVSTKTVGGGFRRAITTKGEIQFNGNPLDVDSYDSADPSASTGGLYDGAKRKANGDVAMNTTASFALGAGKVYGHLQSGPGGKVTSFGVGGAGDLAWFAAGKSGIKPGWFTDDANMTFPNATVPSLAWFSLSSANTTLTTGSYQINSVSLGAGQVMNVTGNVTLYVKSKIDLTSTGKINIAPGASLTIYMSGDTSNFNGGGVVTQSGNPADFTYYGTSMNTYVGFKPQGFIGTVYAPNAELELGTGGGSYTLVGGTVSLNIQLNGNWHFHYDEALGGIGPKTGGDLTVTSWNEITAN